jgi:hypothetical protein
LYQFERENSRGPSRYRCAVTSGLAAASNLHSPGRAPPLVRLKELLEDSMSFFPSPAISSARSLGAAGLLAVLVGCGTNSTHPQPPATSPTRPADALTVGAKAPPFALKDQKGKERTLDDFRKKGMVALVFYRSAKW